MPISTKTRFQYTCSMANGAVSFRMVRYRRFGHAILGLALAVMSGLGAPGVFGQGEEPKTAIGPLMAALDLNGNGKLEADEIDLAVVSLRKLDRNRDGDVTGEEIADMPHGAEDHPAPSQAGTQRPKVSPLFHNLDKDKDGKIARNETPVHMRGSFERLDRNGDGFIDEKEQLNLLRMIRGGAGRTAPDKK